MAYIDCDAPNNYIFLRSEQLHEDEQETEVE